MRTNAAPLHNGWSLTDIFRTATDIDWHYITPAHILWIYQKKDL